MKITQVFGDDRLTLSLKEKKKKKKIHICMYVYRDAIYIYIYTLCGNFLLGVSKFYVLI